MKRAKPDKPTLMDRIVSLIVLSFGLLALSVTSAWGNSNTLVVLGDSISAGYGMKADEGWVALFEQRLADKGRPINVVNESISGEVTAGGLARLPGILERHQPRWLVIELGGNDGLRGLSPKVMVNNLAQMIRMAKNAGVEVFLFGMKLPPNYGAAFNRLFEQAYVDVAKNEEVPLLPFFLEGVGGFSELMQDDRIHPNEQAQQQLVENAWTFLKPHLLSESTAMNKGT
ncbi:MAG: arylesterase [Ketobacteraceae bacterium]|nr:arylesterase [Ketobacteraceae bacterium]